MNNAARQTPSGPLRNLSFEANRTRTARLVAAGTLQEALDAICQLADDSPIALLEWRGRGVRPLASARLRPGSLRGLREALTPDIKDALARGEAVERAGLELAPIQGSTGRLLGVIAAHAVAPRTLSLLQGLAAGAFERAEHVESTRREQQALRRQINQSTRHRAGLDGLLSFTRHELKTPLVGMKGYVDMMLRGMSGALTPTMERYLTRVAAAVQREVEQINSLVHPSHFHPERGLFDLRKPLVGEIEAMPKESIWIRATPTDFALLARTLTRAVRRRGLEVSIVATDDRLTVRFEGVGLDARTGATLRGLAARLQGTFVEGELALPIDPEGRRQQRRAAAWMPT